jgi:hypothetical protein
MSRTLFDGAEAQLKEAEGSLNSAPIVTRRTAQVLHLARRASIPPDAHAGDARGAGRHGLEEAAVYSDQAERKRLTLRLHDELRRGDLVYVRTAREVLATLDEQGSLEGLPFMPEMVSHCGRQFTVERRAEKVCDTIAHSGSRRLHDCVLLDDLRCDGSGHDGCQAECRFYWKEAWLARVEPGEPPPDADDRARDTLLALVSRSARTAAGEAGRRYRCQATELLAASVPSSLTDPRPYVRECVSGNVSIRTFARVMSRATVAEARRKLGLLPSPALAGTSATSPATSRLDLQPGEWVRVKSAEQIRETLNDKGKHRGLWFDAEMLRFCGETFRVRARIERLVDERDGTMIELTSDCVTLEGAVCSGERSTQRWFCPRAIYPYWRECWLERV